MSSASNLAVSVVICTYDRYPSLEEAIRSVLAQTLAADRYEIIVVDNSPDQAKAARMRERFGGEKRLQYLLEPVPGLSNARNVGVAHARARIVAFTDDDVSADRAWLAAILEAFADFPGAGVVGGRVRLAFEGARPAWLPDGLLPYLSLIDLGETTRVKAGAETFAGANIAIARDALDAVGGFSRGLGRIGAGATLLSNEDIDVIDRIAARGRPAIYAPSAVVVHRIDPARLSQSWFRRRVAWQAVSDFLSRPDSTAASAPGAAARLRLLAQERKHQPPGFFTEAKTPGAMLMDTQIAYYAVLALLAGGVEIDPSWLERYGRLPEPAHADSSSESQ